MTITSNQSTQLPSNAQFVLMMSYILSGIGLFLGLLLYLTTLNAEPVSNDLDTDPLPNFDYFFHVVGIILTLLGSFSLFASILFHRKFRIGWIMLSGIYVLGTIGTLYAMYRVIEAMLKYSLFTIPLHIIVPFILGVTCIYLLFQKETRNAFFN